MCPLSLRVRSVAILSARRPLRAVPLLKFSTCELRCQYSTCNSVGLLLLLLPRFCVLFAIGRQCRICQGPKPGGRRTRLQAEVRERQRQKERGSNNTLLLDFPPPLLPPAPTSNPAMTQPLNASSCPLPSQVTRLIEYQSDRLRISSDLYCVQKKVYAEEHSRFNISILRSLLPPIHYYETVAGDSRGRNL